VLSLQLEQSNKKLMSTLLCVKQFLVDWQVQAKANTKEMHPTVNMH